MNNRLFTSKQMGDAAEMLIAANLTLNGVPSIIAPVNWPGYDVIAAPRDKPLQKISVKCRGTSPIKFRPEKFHWLAIVLIKEEPYQFFIIPVNIAVKHSTLDNNGLHTIYVQNVSDNFKKYQDNFKLSNKPATKEKPRVLMTAFGS